MILQTMALLPRLFVTAIVAGLLHLSTQIPAAAGPYSQATHDSSNPHDAPIPGFVEIAASSVVNPLFFGWADSIASYSPAPGVSGGWMVTSLALGEVTGEYYEVVSLGDLYDETNPPPSNPESFGFTGEDLPGSITVTLDRPLSNLSGADFAVFENGIISNGSTGVAGEIFGELAFVEVSSDGVNFVRFPAHSQTPSLVGAYGSIDPTNIFNLVGKHVNAGGDSWGTPFDLASITSDPLVIDGTVDLTAITQIRLVDIPGNGFFKDAFNNPIYDPWVTWSSGGADIEALGIIATPMEFPNWPQLTQLPASDRDESDDPDHDGLTNLMEYAFALLPLEFDSSEAYRMELIQLGNGSQAAEFIFRRDERATDLHYEVQVSGDLNKWTTIAASLAGSPVEGVNGFTPEIASESAIPIASVGVVREVRVRDVELFAHSERRFFRVKVTRLP